MKFFIYEDGGTVDASATFGGMTLEGFLSLNQYPTDGTEAVNKEYVDGLSKELPSGGVTTGTMSTDRFPDMEGELQSAAGTGIIELSPTGVVAGNHPKVTVNKGGVVTVGEVLSSADIPGFGWEKISEVGRPTSLSRYGITNGIDLNGGVILGNIKLHSEPELGGDAVTKNYVGGKISNIVGYTTGDVITGEWDTTPEGFLQCNGGEVAKDLYPALYSIIGDSQSEVGMKFGAGTPWVTNYHTTNNIGAVGNWVSGPVLPVSIEATSVLVTKNKIFTIGGYNVFSNTYTKDIYVSNINQDGTLSGWSLYNYLPRAVGWSTLFVTKNRVYLIGGVSGPTLVKDVWFSEIDEDGNLGTWTAGISIPDAAASASSFITKNYAYLVGGTYNTTSSSSSKVLRAPIDSRGILGKWEETFPLPYTTSRCQLIVVGDKVHVLGGNVGSTNYSLDTTAFATINEDGTLGPWVNGPKLPYRVDNFKAFCTKERIYITGGHLSMVGYYNNISAAVLNPDNTIGSWVAAGTLANTIHSHALVLLKDKLHSIGGSTTSVGTMNWTGYAPFIGGSNDYSKFYNGSYFIVTDPTKFKLPTHHDSTRTLASNYYIKY